LPGANAIIPALVGSGLPTDGFVYLGFLPRRDKALRELLALLAAERRTLVAYESPNRLVDTLAAVLDTLGDRPVCVARELSKTFEEFQRGTASAVRAHYEANPPRGEITLVIGGAPDTPPARWDEEQVRVVLAERIAAGQPLKEAARQIASESGWERRAVYALGTGLRKSP
jgi:16S rRNA (cytidine1402-2'-O)-methyltransferase